MSIFKAYDIRGKYPAEINEGLVQKISKAFCEFLKPKTIVIGMDMRLSSESLQNEIINSVTNQGIKVISIGLVSTPMFYFGVNHFNADAGIMITASHNPKEYNGLKLVEKEARPINYDNGISQIEKMINNSFINSKIKGEIIEKNILNEYLQYLKKFKTNLKKLKIVIDYGNGMNSVPTKKLLQSLNLEVINLYDNLDGSFPNHEANPLKEENTRFLQKKVLEEKADLRVAFDGDG
ncbi:MAG: phosphomannomutase/phosphoglucomutase, partial [Candidatus Nanoarchaeia archaeon]|nr:phosphomannomutase/phosphoglucomutase [Candidatus Nanoarchaeia archaeon]